MEDFVVTEEPLASTERVEPDIESHSIITLNYSAIWYKSHMLLIAPFLIHLVMAATDAIITAIIIISTTTPNVERVMHRPAEK